MAFFLIVPSVMIVNVLLVHALANRMGLKIYYGTLIAVAVSAFVVDFAAVLISPAAGKAFFLRLGLFVAAAAFLLTVANSFFVKRKRAEEKNFNEEVRAAFQAEVEESKAAEKTSADAEKPSVTVEDVTDAKENVAPLQKFEWGDGSTTTDASFSEPTQDADFEGRGLTLSQKVEAQENSSGDDRQPARYNEISKPADKTSEPADKTSEPDAETSTPPKKSEATEDFPLDEVFTPLESLKIETLEKFAREEQKSKPEPPPKPSEVFPFDEVFKPLEAVKPEALEKISDEKISLPKPAPAVADEKISPPAEKLKPSAEKKSSDDKTETLDDILDKAYSERAKGHVWQAIDFYRRALERYRNDEYAPFVAIDLGNVFKEEALYSKAIKIYEEALTLPAVVRNAATRKEFVKNLEYLRAVQVVLRRRRALSTPFSKIPKELLNEIDAELRATQLHSK